jgi:hypothetical protein
MKEIEIKNQEVLDVLNQVLYFYKNTTDINNVKPQGLDHKHEKNKFMSEDYLNKIIDMSDRHDGYPEALLLYNLYNKDYAINRDPRALPLNWLEKYQDINKQLMALLSVRRNAVASLYPPGGFISWHNNANATGFNLIFTWSENGDGWFDYIEDNGKGKRVRCQDKAGQWVCRYGMFGSYHQNDYPIVYHAASSENSWRITLAYVFSKEELSAGLQEFIIEELTTP